MEQQQFLYEDSDDPIQLTQGFQIDRFNKKANNLNIPDTIPENCSGELSVDGLKMEASKTIKDNFNLENKENINQCAKQQDVHLNTSVNIAIDNSYLKECERKLLESSNSDDEKSSEPENKTVVNKMLLNVPSKSLHNDTISTPPSALRREISFLRNEMAEVHEFHDLEIQLLKEEKCLHDPEPDNYVELFEKYSSLMELYTTLKTEYDEYRKEQEQMRQELQSKTADCLESLCSQIEASDNSLNFSGASFVSFNGGIKSSTMMEDISEVEATVMHEGTILAHDPLAMSTDGVFKTPMQTPVRSGRKSSLKKPLVKEIKDLMAKKDVSVPLDSEHNIQLLNLEAALYEKMKEAENLEQRLFKVEDLCTVLQNEFERITAIHEKETEALRKTLSTKTEQLNELTDKLFTETISLDPSLKDSLIDIPSTKLLVIFIETIMESCRKIQNELIAKHNREKSEWESKQTKETTSLENLREELEDSRKTCESLQEKLTKAESVLLTRDEEIRLLQSHLSNARQKQEDFEATRQTILELEARLTLSEAEKAAAENRYRELEAFVRELERSLEEKEKTRLEEKSEVEKIVEDLKTNFATTESKLAAADENITQLKQQLQSIELDKTELENRCNELERLNQNLQNEVVGETNELSHRLLESEKTLENLRTELEVARNENNQMQELLEKLKNENSNYSNALTFVEEKQKRLSEMFENIANDSELPIDQIMEIIERETEANETRETKIISTFMDTIRKTCRGVQSQLVERFEKEKLKWDTQKNEDVCLIENLHSQIEGLNEKSKEKEEKIAEINLEKEELVKAHESLKSQMEEAEKIILSCNEQIKTLQSHRDILKQTREDLDTAETLIEQLKVQLNEKLESEKVYQTELETTKKELDELKIQEDEHKTENSALKKQIHELQSEIDQLRDNANIKESRVLQLQTDVETLTEKITTIEETNKRLRETLMGIQKLLHLSDEDMTNLEIYQEKIESYRSKDGRETELSEKLSTAQSAIAKREEEISVLLNDLTTARNSLEEVITRLTEKQNLVKTLEEQNEKIQTELLNTKEAESKIVTENKDLKESLDAKISEIESFKEEMRQLQTDTETESGKMKEEIQALQNEITNMQGVIASYEGFSVQLGLTEYEKDGAMARCEELKDRLEKMIEEKDNLLVEYETEMKSYNNLKTQMAQSETLIQSHEKEIETLEEKIKQYESLSNKLTSTEDEKCKAESRHEDLEKQLAKETEEKMQLQTELQNGADLYNNLKNQLEDAQKKIECLEKEILTLKEERDDLSNRLITTEDDKTKVEGAWEEIKKQFKETTVEKEKLLAELTNTHESVVSLEKEVETLKEEITKMEDIMSNNKERLIQAEEEKTKAKNEYEELKKQLQEVIEEREKLSAELTEKTNSHNNLEAEMIKRQSTIESLSREIQTLKEKMTNYESLSNRLTSTEDDKRKAETECKELKEQFEKIVEEKEKLSTELTTEKNTQETLKTQITEKQSFIESLQAELTNMEKMMANHTNQLTEAESKCEELKQLVENLKVEISEKEKLQLESETEKKHLKESYENLKTETKEKICSRESELTTVKENLLNADETIQKLETQLKSVETEKTENEDLRKRIRDSEKTMEELKNELDSAKESQLENIKKVEELIQEIEELKKENAEYTNVLTTIEETQKNLACVLSDVTKDLPSDRIEQFIAAKGPERKIVSDIVETISKTCKGVQNELLEKFDSEKVEWETRKDVDLQNLQHQIKVLTSEMEKLEEERANVRVEKLEMEVECRKVKETVSVLQTEIETKETIIRGLGELKLAKENENDLLKQQVMESEEVIVRLRKSLEMVKDEQNERDMKISDLTKEIESVKKERDGYLALTDKMETLEKSNKNLVDILSDWQRHLDVSEDTIAKLLSGKADGKKILSERLNAFTKAQTEGLSKENKTLRLGNETLKDKVKQLTKLMGESALKDENGGVSNGRTKAGKKMELCLRRLDKVEELNHNLTELVTWILTATEFPGLEKLKMGSVSEFPNVLKKVMAHVNDLNGRLKDLKEEKAELEEECETYAKVIKDLEKDAKDMWKTNKEKTEALEAEIERLKEEKADLAVKLNKLESEYQKLKSAPKTEGSTHNCNCGNDSKKINELKRTILVKEQKLLELQDLAAQTNSYKSQIEYLKTALEREKKKVSEEKEKNKKLEKEMKETKTSQTKKKGEEENEVLEELRMRGSISGGIVQEFVDKEKMKKLSKDIGILKELCRARYAEIKRLEAANAALKNGASKNSNQLDSPIRSIGHNTRSKTQIRKMEMKGKENSCL